MFVLWYQHAKRLEKRVARIGSRTPRGSHLVNSSLSSLLLLKCPSYCNLPGICHNLAWWNLPYERDKTTTTKNIFHTTFKHHYISFLWTFHLFSFPYCAHPYIHSKQHFTHNLSRGTYIIINRDKESLLWQLHKQLCYPERGRQITGCCPVMIWTAIFVHMQAHRADF